MQSLPTGIRNDTPTQYPTQPCATPFAALARRACRQMRGAKRRGDTETAELYRRVAQRALDAHLAQYRQHLP